MQKVHKIWPYSSELAFIDSTTILIRVQHRVFTLPMHIFASALPLDIIISSTEKEGACGFRTAVTSRNNLREMDFMVVII